jgi:putative membrane protein insertion efficiency factor
VTPARAANAAMRSPVALLLRVLILAYRYSLSMLIGRRCRYLPTCSEFADEAIARHGAWAGGWMAAGRFCRCHPWGGAGYDPVPTALPSDACWSRPWRYARGATRPACERVAEG